MARAPERSICPWKRADIRSLISLCEYACRLCEPTLLGLMGATHGPNPITDIAAARKTLTAHPIYLWIESTLPGVLRLTPVASPDAQFRFVRLVVQFMVIAFAEAVQPQTASNRTDKKRVAAWDAIDRVEGIVDIGLVVLTPAKRDMLRQFLAEAKSELMSKRAKGVKHPALLGFAYALQRDFAIADAKIITAFASATGINCSERTAQRYVVLATTA